MAFNDIYRFRLWGRIHGQAICNVLHFKEDVPVGGTGAAGLCTDFNTNMATTMKNRLASSSGYTFEYMECQRLVPYGDVPLIQNWTGGNVGAVGGNCLTGTLAEVLTLYTGQAGRRKRGRIYLAGGVGTDIFQGQWATTQTARTQAFATALATRYCVVPYATSYVLGVWSRVIAGPAPPYTTNAFTPVTSITVRTTVRNQRRRQLGVGR